MYLQEHNIDVFLGPVFIAPIDWDGPTVVTVHDLVFEKGHELNTEKSNDYYTKWAKQCSAKAGAIVTVSQCIADDINKLWDIKDTHIHAVPLAPSLPLMKTLLRNFV